MTRLSDLQAGDTGLLCAMECSSVLRSRLMELGFLPGALVRLVRRIPVADLVEIECRGCHLSLRMSEADRVVVELT